MRPIRLGSPAAPGDASGEPEAPHQAKPRWPLVAADSGTDASTQQFAGWGSSAGTGQTGVSQPWQLTTPADPVISRLVRRAARAVAAWY